MKPILVNNQTEWDKLAPVLEKQGYVWTGDGKKPTDWSPYLNFHARGKLVIFQDKSEQECKAIYWGDTYKEIKLAGQTVDEYLAMQEQNHKPLFDMPIYKATDYKALYEAQTRAIQKGLEEIDVELKKQNYNPDEWVNDYCIGLLKIKEILTEKLGNINKIG